MFNAEMFVAAAMVLVVGFGAARTERGARYYCFFVGLCLASGALLDGHYWNLFGRGKGFFTLNRVSAAAFFVTLLFGPLLFEIAKAAIAKFKSGSAKDDEWVYPGIAHEVDISTIDDSHIIAAIKRYSDKNEAGKR